MTVERSSVFRRAVEVFGSASLAEGWLLSPALALGGDRPVDVLAEPEGAEVVLTLLGRIEHCVYT